MAQITKPIILDETGKEIAAAIRLLAGGSGGGGSNVEQYGLPILRLDGDVSAMTKENAVDLNYEYGDRKGVASVKWQGSSSLSYPKKNYTIKFDNAFEAREGWGKQKKYCLKANFIDHSHARNVVSAKLWGQVVKSRDFEETTETLAHAFVEEGAGNDAAVYTETTAVKAFSIRKQSTTKGGRLYINFDNQKIERINVQAHLFDENNNVIKQLYNWDNSTNTPTIFGNGGDFDESAWMNTGSGEGTIDLKAPLSIAIPDGCTCMVYILIMSNTNLPDGTLTFAWSSEAEKNGTWVYTWARDGGITATVEKHSPFERLLELPNGGAVDGFPVIITLNGEFHGLYTFNIPKDGWMFGMGSSRTVTKTENLAFDTYVSDIKDTTGEYTPATSVSGLHIRKLSTTSGGRCYVNWNMNKLTGFGLVGYLFDSDNVLRKTFCGHNGSVLNPYYGNVKGELGEDAWLNADGVRCDAIYPKEPFSIPVPNGYSVLWYVVLPTEEIKFPDGTLTKDWSSQAELNNTWVYTWVKTGINFEVVTEVVTENEAKEAIFCADTTSEATRFQTTATLNGDFELEYVNDEDNAEWALSSLNRLINACLNSNGTDLDTTIASYLDWSSAIDYYIFACLIGGADMAGKNYLLATFEGEKWVFSAYDMDSTFGLWWNGKEFLPNNHYPTVGWYASYHKVMQFIRNYKWDAFKARYAELRNTVLSEDNVALAFENFIKDIPTPVFNEDVKKWTTIPSSSVNNVSQIRDWYRRRVAVIDKEVEAL